jgi:hypothetical protein
MRAIQYLEKHDIALQQSLTHWFEESRSGGSAYYEEFFNHDMLYWFATLDGKHNHAKYTYGELLMTYLEETYGSYISWMSFIPTSDKYLANLTAEQEIGCFEAAYGAAVFENFYAWFAKYSHSDYEWRGIYSPYSKDTYDLSKLYSIVAYPVYKTLGNYTNLGNYSFFYNDLYINIEETVRYLRGYKGENIDDLMLVLSDAALVYLFDAEGYLLKAAYGTQISLDGVSFVKLVGEGYMGCVDIVGYYPASKLIQETTILFSETATDHQYHYGIQYGRDDIILPWYYQLLFRDDVTVVLKLSTPCRVEVVDLAWNTVRYENVTEVVLDDARYWAAFNWTVDEFDFEVIAIPNNP